MIPIVAVVGPTASGKTELAIALAVHFNSEIISADSMQVYRGMEIGTGAPTPKQLRLVPHHFISAIAPDAPWSAGAFQSAARPIVARLEAAGKPAIVAGGSGLYVRALIDGLFGGPFRDADVRRRLNREAGERGVPALYQDLLEVDPVYAQSINPNDLRRIVRALEVFEVSGAPFSELHARHAQQPQPIESLQVALDYPRDELYARIDRRVDRLIEMGLLEEVRALVANGYEHQLARLRTLGYPELLEHIRGQCSLEDAVSAIKQNTRRFAKRQLTWFRADPRVHWIPASTDRAPESYLDQVLSCAINI